MYMFLFEGMLNSHTEEKNLKIIRQSKVKKKVFNTLLLGQNLISTICIDCVAKYLATLSDEKCKKITLDDIVRECGEIYGTTGYLV